MKAGVVALLILLASSACSGEANGAASPNHPRLVQIALPAQPDGPVLDQADILPPENEAALDSRLRGLWDDTHDALVVVTVDSLQGKAIEDYAFTLFNDWGIGDGRTGRGLLLLVAPNEREVRIEVGCGLESTVTDEFAASVIQNQILPEFRIGDFSAGTAAGTETLITRLALPKAANDPGPHTDPCKAAARKSA